MLRFGAEVDKVSSVDDVTAAVVPQVEGEEFLVP